MVCGGAEVGENGKFHGLRNREKVLMFGNTFDFCGQKCFFNICHTKSLLLDIEIWYNYII